ncbi:hypothetical protein DPEC_G00299770 [Dallia pectoralis]|uniref:Uncharacterized protein n=1 Tax=Dallia pectoralis TaxID=75939 RepID=A0ACC2FGD4_DALPE|nr:hypothetical protein DPEC_G00299770 [Dallia pectoralis]
MSVIRKISKRLSSKKKSTPVNTTQDEVIAKLGLKAYLNAPLDLTVMLDINTWSLENHPPPRTKNLPRAFLRRLWLLSPQARSTRCQPPAESPMDAPQGEIIPSLIGGDSQCLVNPLDMVVAVYRSANSFLQLEMSARMVQRQFAVPLLLPAITPDQSVCFLLWSLRGVVGQWRPHSLAENSGISQGGLVSTAMPLISCVKLGHCSVSKSQVLSHLVGRPQNSSECFLHRGMEGGQLPRRLADGLVELCWCLPCGDRDVFPEPVAIANLRGDGTRQEKQVSFLCRVSSVIIVFCGNLGEKERQLLASLEGRAKRVILIDLCRGQEESEKNEVEMLNHGLNLPEESVLSGRCVREEELANQLSKTLNHLLPDRLTYVTIEDAASIAEELGLMVDENAMCKKALAQVEEVLTGIENGANHYRALNLPLQGAFWSRLAEVEKVETRQKDMGEKHFLRELGLVFELTNQRPGSGTHNVLRLPSVAADLLLYGVPLEILDGDASNMPCSWVGCVMAEFNRRLPFGTKVRVLTSLGIHNARNSEMLSALFGVQFPSRSTGNTRGAYLLALGLPDNLKEDMQCDFLLMIDVEGLRSTGLSVEQDNLKHDNEMAAMVSGLSDVILQNMPPDGETEIHSTLPVIVNALLRTRGSGAFPISQLLTQGVGLNSKLLSLQIQRVTQVLEAVAETSPGVIESESSLETVSSSIPCLIGPWQNNSLSVSVDEEYSSTILQVKQDLLGALKRSATKSKAASVPEFIERLCTVWKTVKGATFPFEFGETEVGEAFCIMCTELSQWEKNLLEHMDVWFMGTLGRFVAGKAATLEKGCDPLDQLNKEAITEVKVEVEKIRSTLEDNLKKDDLHIRFIEKFKPNFFNSLNAIQKRATSKILEKLQTATEDHYFSTTLMSFTSVLNANTEVTLHRLIESSKLNKCLLNDKQLEEEFDSVWSESLSTTEFRTSEKEDITACVIQKLKENLNDRGLHKHMQKLNAIGQEIPSSFTVNDEHFGYRSRLKHMLEVNNRLQMLQAHRLATKITDEYNNFVRTKSALAADFSASYITDALEIVDKALKTKTMDIRSAFEVDLKVYLCSHACRDFQVIHDQYARDGEFLVYLNGKKDGFKVDFIYQFRKRDQAQRVAGAFTTMVLRPSALDYIYRPLGLWIKETVTMDDSQRYLSPRAFKRCVLEELIREDSFESFLEYLLSYESFSLKRIRKKVEECLAGTTAMNEQREQRLGEIIGKMASAVSLTSHGESRVLSDISLLLEKVCLNLEADGEVTVNKDSMECPLFHITTDWARFVTCLLESLAEMRLALSQQFSKDREVSEVLRTLPVKPQNSLFSGVRGCEKRCPFCKAPCEAGASHHEVHSALLHRPKGLLSYTRDDSGSLSHHTCPSDMARDSLFQNQDTDAQPRPYRDYRSLYPDWHITPEDPSAQTVSAYWRYVLVRFNSRFAHEYQREPAVLPGEWHLITQEEALESLKKAFPVEA